MAEARFRPSAADRWIRCPASVQHMQGAVSRTSDAAREGSAAHSVAEMCLRNGQEAIEYADRGIQLNDGGDPVFLSPEDCDAVQLYIDTVRGYNVSGTKLLIEQRMSMSVLDPNDPLLAENEGTSDAVIIDEENAILTICDLKFGKGIPVPADSYQLKDYGLMAMFKYQIGKPWRIVRTVVAQVRAIQEDDRIKIAEHDPGELQDFIGTMYGAMQASQAADAQYVPGEKQCKWCDKSRCPALQREAIEVARKAFERSPLPLTLQSKPVITPKEHGIDPSIIATADAGMLADWLERRAVVDAFLKAVEERACAVLEAGGKIPGWKLVQRSGNRKWKDEAETKSALISSGVPENQIFTEPKLKSPAQIEKLKITGIKIAPVIEKLCEKPLGAPTLVRATDDRPGLPGAFSQPLPATVQGLPPLPGAQA